MTLCPRGFGACWNPQTRECVCVEDEELRSIGNPCPKYGIECAVILLADGDDRIRCPDTTPRGRCCFVTGNRPGDCGTRVDYVTAAYCESLNQEPGVSASWTAFGQCITDDNPRECGNRGACCFRLGCRNSCSHDCDRENTDEWPSQFFPDQYCEDTGVCPEGSCCSTVGCSGPMLEASCWLLPGGIGRSWVPYLPCSATPCAAVGACCVCGNCELVTSGAQCSALFGAFHPNETCEQVAHRGTCLNNQRHCERIDALPAVVFDEAGHIGMAMSVEAELDYIADSLVPCGDYEGQIAIGLDGVRTIAHAEIGNQWSPSPAVCETVVARTVIRDDGLTPTARFQLSYRPACLGIINEN